jgi:hypothetical protein
MVFLLDTTYQSEEESFGSVGDSVMSCCVCLEAVLWEDAWRKQTGERIFYSGRCLRGCVLLGNSMGITQQSLDNGPALVHHTTLHWALLMTLSHWYTLQLFAGLHWCFACCNFMKFTKELHMVFWLLLTTSADSCCFSRASQLLLDQKADTDSHLAFAN